MDKHYNGHRKGKKRFDVSLKPDEAKLVERAKVRTKTVTNKELLLKLCERG